MIGIFGAMTLLSILCAAARIYTRVRLLRMPGMDDAVIVFTVVGVLQPKQANLNAYLLSLALTETSKVCLQVKGSQAFLY